MRTGKSACRSWALGLETRPRAGSELLVAIRGRWAPEADGLSASKSSLLQVFVSISGLVLVRNPYHCEPAFAKLEGTREGLINSYASFLHRDRDPKLTLQTAVL